MPVTVGDLPEVLKAHRLWLKSDGKKGILANLSGANLFEANLRKANLSEANLIGTNLSEANLSEANLVGTNLRKANLNEASLIEANLRRADLNFADLIGADLFEANLSGANLIGANLSFADLIGADLFGANLSGANLAGANLSRSSLTNSDLREADISGACLDDANTSHWNIEDIICTHLLTGPDRKRIDYAPKEFEQKHIYLDKLSDIVLNLQLSELTHYVGLMTESAINQHQPSIPIRFKGQEALSDKTTKLFFIVFASDDDEVRKTEDQLDAIGQNVIALVGNTREIRQFVEDERELKRVLGLRAEIPLVPSSPAPVIRPAEIERILTERRNQIPQIIKKVWECIQSSIAH